MKNWRKLSLELYAAAFGWRVEIDMVPFQWAKPQVGLSSSLGDKVRTPSLKAGPFHVWTMRADKIEIGFSADLRAAFHTHVFERVYPDSFVWPDYKPREAR